MNLLNNLTAIILIVITRLDNIANNATLGELTSGEVLGEVLQ